MPPQSISSKKKQISELATRLQAAAEAYYNSDTLLMTDTEYDAALEQLRALDPKHPLLLKVGAEEEGASELPYKMASLNKVHPDFQGGGGAVKRWVSKQKLRGAKSFLLTEKLDGLSCLLVKQGAETRVWLRGNGVKGVELKGLGDFFLRGCTPLTQSFAVRGELVLSQSNTPEGSIGRSLVNGWIHRAARGERFPELTTIDFVAYQLLEPSALTRQEQIEWLRASKICLPRFTVVTVDTCVDSLLEKVLKGWKESGLQYPIDGIVVAPWGLTNELTGREEDLKNPADMVAFKMILDEQVRETTVVAVHWAASAQGYLIPRIEIEPVEISGARIQFCSGHNARAIVNGCLGPAARIELRRSGDVIPTLNKVIRGCSDGPSLPSSVSEIKWEWVGDEETATHIRVKGEGAVSATAGKRIEHCLTVFGVKGVGPGCVDMMVRAGLITVKQVYSANADTLATILGAVRGRQIFEALRAPLQTCTEADFLIASSLLPRGCGHRKLAPLFAKESDPRKWNTAPAIQSSVPDGWTKKTLDDLLSHLPDAIRWREETFGDIPWRLGKAAAAASESKGVVAGSAGTVVFTGVRDKELEGVMKDAGWEIGDSVTRATTLLILADGASAETGKAKKAVTLGIPIQNLSQSRARWINP